MDPIEDRKPPFQLYVIVGLLFLAARVYWGWHRNNIVFDAGLMLVGLGFWVGALIQLVRVFKPSWGHRVLRVASVAVLVIVPILGGDVSERMNAFSWKHQFSDAYFSLLQKDCDALILAHAQELHALEAAGDKQPSIDFHRGEPGYARLPGSIRQLDPYCGSIQLDHVYMDLEFGIGQLEIYRTGLVRSLGGWQKEVAKGIYLVDNRGD